MRVRHIICVALLVGACKKSTPPPIDYPFEVDVSPSCRVERALGEKDACFAIRCAEDFIRRNGYTNVPPSEPIALETLERSEPSRLLDSRRGIVKPKAVHYRGGDVHTVLFEYSDGSSFKAVQMGQDFANLLVQHQDVIVKTLDHPDC